MPIRIKRGETLPLLLTAAERDAVVKEVMPPTLEDKLQLGLAKHGEVEFQLTLDELEDLQGWVAATANHTKKKRLGALLDEVFLKIDSLLTGYTDQ